MKYILPFDHYKLGAGAEMNLLPDPDQFQWLDLNPGAKLGIPDRNTCQPGLEISGYPDNWMNRNRSYISGLSLL